MKIKNKEDIINHFIAGSKNHQNIGVENEKFIFDNKSKKRSTYNQIVNVLNFLNKNYGWNKVLENNNLIEAKFNNVSSATLCTTLKNNHGVLSSIREPNHM